MAQAFRPASSSNYHPVASDYVISYSRKKEQFKLPRYSQLVEAPGPAFYYFELDRDAAIRIPGGSAEANAFADGAARPIRDDNHQPFRELPGVCVRYSFTAKLGDIALQMAQKQWEAKTAYLNMLTSQAMTSRTKTVWRGHANSSGAWKGLDTASMWPSTNVADVNALNGGAGTWDAASADPADSSYMAIRKALTEAAVRIFLNTNGVVQWSDLRLVLHPDAARAMGNSSEIREFYKYGGATTEKALDVDNMNAQYGLPAKLYGIEVVVEDTMFLDEPPTAGATSASANREFVKSKTNAVILSRQGKIDAQVGPSFSTFQLWYYGDQLTVEEFADPENRLTKWHLTDFYVPVAPALVSGFLIQNCVSPGA